MLSGVKLLLIFWREVSALIYDFTCEITMLPWQLLTTVAKWRLEASCAYWRDET